MSRATIECSDTLLSMLTYARPAGSPTEQEFIARFLQPLGVTADGAGNQIMAIGPDPTTMFSCHTDTVHKTDGRQTLAMSGRLITLDPKSSSTCLGSDDAAGIWLMTEMIKAGISGLYVFHASEERGGIGSAHIALNKPETLDGIQRAIAFDRRGTTSVITKQAGGRCCSDTFALELAAKLGPQWVPDPGGVFTDTANYSHLIPECTNLSVGYAKEHSKAESLDYVFLQDMLKALLKIDFDSLPTERKPWEVEPVPEFDLTWTTPKKGKAKKSYYYDDWQIVDDVDYRYPTPRQDLEAMARRNPEALLTLCFDLGASEEDIHYYLTQR